MSKHEIIIQWLKIIMGSIGLYFLIRLYAVMELMLKYLQQ